MTDRLPDGYVIELSANVRYRDSGTTLVGGAPKSILYLEPAAEEMLDARRLTVTDNQSAEFGDLLIDLGMAHPVVHELPVVDPDLVTYVIPVVDRPAQLERVLASIGENAQIIVVDDGSRDPHIHERVARAHGSRFIALPVNMGPGAARNAGLREVTTPYVAFVDSDVVVDSQMVPHLVRHFADPKVALVLPRVLGLHGSEETNWIGRYENSRSSLDLGELPSLVHPRAVASWVPGTCTIARVDRLEGGFAEDLRVGEDVDLGWRLGNQGWRVRYDPSVQVRHDHRVKFGAWMRRKAFYGGSSSALTKRFPYYVAPALLSPSNIVTMVAVVAARRWSVPVIAAVWAIIAVRNVVKLRPATSRVRLGILVATEDLVATQYQLMGILLRHWWPISVVVGVFSKRFRYVLAAAAVVDAVLARRRNRAELDLPRYFVARRLDDLAFGAGVWLSAWRERTIRTFFPDLRRKPGVTANQDLGEVVRPTR